MSHVGALTRSATDTSMDSKAHLIIQTRLGLLGEIARLDAATKLNRPAEDLIDQSLKAASNLDQLEGIAFTLIRALDSKTIAPELNQSDTFTVKAYIRDYYGLACKNLGVEFNPLFVGMPKH